MSDMTRKATWMILAVLVCGLSGCHVEEPSDAATANDILAHQDNTARAKQNIIDTIENDEDLRPCAEQKWPDTPECRKMALVGMRVQQQFWIAANGK